MDQNSFLLTLNSKLLTYLHSKNILTDDQFVDYIKNVNTKQIKTLTYEELIDYKSQKHQRIF